MPLICRHASFFYRFLTFTYVSARIGAWWTIRIPDQNEADSMTAEDLIELLEERPFVPVRLHLDNGRFHDIRHPEMAIVTPTLVAIGFSQGSGSRLVERVRLCSIAHVVEAEPIEPARQS
jgi:hypothetical protein